jgi:hypothetical protein
MIETEKLDLNSDLPQDVADFVVRYFQSVASLELFLFVQGLRPLGMSALELSQEMRSNPSYAEALLSELEGKGLIVSEGTDINKKYYYRPEGRPDKETQEKLALYYVQKRFRIINLIYNSPLEKIKTFVDAFKIRK